MVRSLLVRRLVKYGVLTAWLIVHTATSGPNVVVHAWRILYLGSGTILVIRNEWKMELEAQKMKWAGLSGNVDGTVVLAIIFPFFLEIERPIPTLGSFS